jgi:GH25 family lysozyme M1 (1,4-beta-N-acetylmuramidase)
MNGFDVSKHNGTIDWGKVDAADVDFALIRAGYGNDISQKDPKFDENMQGALSHKLHPGAYWFSYAISPDDARKEAEVFKQVLAPFKGKVDFPVAFDYEYDSIDYSKKQGISPTNALIDSIARTFMDSMRADGWFVNLYTNLDFIRSGKFSTDTIAKYDLWLADYTGGPDVQCDIQQTGSAGVIPGIRGNVDIDVAFKDYPSIIRAGGYNGYPKQFTCDTSGTVEIALGGCYTAKTTGPVQLVAGTPYVVQIVRCLQNGYALWHIIPIGQPGQAAGIYPAGGDKLFTVIIK